MFRKTTFHKTTPTFDWVISGETSWYVCLIGNKEVIEGFGWIFEWIYIGYWDEEGESATYLFRGTMPTKLYQPSKWNSTTRFEEVIYLCFIGDKKDIETKFHLPSKWNGTKSPQSKTISNISMRNCSSRLAPINIIIVTISGSTSSTINGKNGDGDKDESE